MFCILTWINLSMKCGDKTKDIKGLEHKNSGLFYNSIWHMLTKREDYRHSSPARTRFKMTRLNYMASGIKRRTKVDRKMKKGIGRKAEREYMVFVKRRIGKRER